MCEYINLNLIHHLFELMNTYETYEVKLFCAFFRLIYNFNHLSNRQPNIEIPLARAKHSK